jgi:hypothetical protein
MAEDDRTLPKPAANRADQQGPAEGRTFDASELDDRNAADLADSSGDLGQEDNPQEDWGPEGDPQMLHSANHTRRPLKTEAERGQGAKTRRANKDIVSRRTS